MNDAPPDTIYYSQTGGKTAPWYHSLAGIKSAFKTSWGARAKWAFQGGKPPKVYRGTVRWEEIDLEGRPIIRVTSHPGDRPWGPSLDVHLSQGLDFRGHGIIVPHGQDLNMIHDLSHKQRQDLTHGH